MGTTPGGQKPDQDAGAGALGPLLDDLQHAADVAAGTTSPDAVERARDSLKATLDALQLTPEEAKAMAPELARLRELAVKLDETTVEIVAFGMVSRGKSSVLNALLGRDLFEVGATHGTTVRRSTQEWAESGGGGFPEARLILVDTPGIDEVGGEVREAQARDAARRADLILFVVSGDMQRIEIDALIELRRHKKPILLVFNQVDRYPDADRDAIHAMLEDERVKGFVRPEDVVLCAARPDPVLVKVRTPDGATRTEWERPAPLIEPLKVRILDVLEREGKALVALNTLLTAGDLHAEILERKVRIREDAANRLIWNYSLAKGAAVALNPIPVADLAGGLAVDVAMILALSRVYGIPLSRSAAVRLVRDMSLALGATGLIQVATRLVGSGVKASMAGLTVMSGGLAAPLTALGYGAIGLTQAVASSSASYVIGRAAGTYLRQGGQWGPRGVKTVVQELLAQAKADSIVDRLRDELKSQLKR
ncbi:YcjF family protein [Paludisphaera mucosa]|uniref:GTP-binding protein n=1 Tax=Paludisphaera mucosa TaxID=3030827 RepID=A0ABT6F9P7_9BACT|nr:GTP-binding protein [Paludisphaera mucosa]MDG3004105.1 GTP-binding protein [Paludisphaera mucosa]